MVDEAGEIEWYNDCFRIRMAAGSDIYGQSIYDHLPQLDVIFVLDPGQVQYFSGVPGVCQEDGRASLRLPLPLVKLLQPLAKSPYHVSQHLFSMLHFSRLLIGLLVKILLGIQKLFA